MLCYLSNYVQHANIDQAQEHRQQRDGAQPTSMVSLSATWLLLRVQMRAT
jgi:hypothetical protein